MVEETLLSSSVTIAQYRELKARRDREGIAHLIQERFTERYIDPLREGKKHGFCTMAISCLMIEALESFRNGWCETRRRSREAFGEFFKRCRDEESALGVFYEQSDDFYYDVRCGILHQAETRNGWRIHRRGPLFDPTTKIINATRFHDELEKVLMTYCDRLKQKGWDSEVWQNLRTKMKAVIRNCSPSRE